MKLPGLIACLIAATTLAATPLRVAPWKCEANDGAPFGPVSDADAGKLFAFATANGLDLEHAVRSAYAGDRSSLAKVFQLSLKFRSLDAPARVYGNMLFSMLLNLGERDVTPFLSVLATEPAAVQQRARDFLWFPVLCTPIQAREEAERRARTDVPGLFPPAYVFAKNDPLFDETPNSTLAPPGEKSPAAQR